MAAAASLPRKTKAAAVAGAKATIRRQQQRAASSSSFSSKQQQQQQPRSATTKLVTSAIQSQIQTVQDDFSETTTWKEWFFNSMALVSLTVSGLAFFASGGGLMVSLVSGVCAFLGPCAALQQQRLTDLRGLRQIQNELRDQVNRLSLQNSSLAEENHQLAQSAKRLKQVESNLQALEQLQGQSVQTLMEQVQEYGRIQSQIQTSLQSQVIANLMEVVIRSDRDDDFMIDKQEVHGLLTRLHAIPGVDFSEANFRKAIRQSISEAAAGGEGGSNEEVHQLSEEDIDDIILNQRGGFDLRTVMDVVKNLIDDRVAPEDNIFTIHTEDLLPRRLNIGGDGAGDDDDDDDETKTKNANEDDGQKTNSNNDDIRGGSALRGRF